MARTGWGLQVDSETELGMALLRYYRDTGYSKAVILREAIILLLKKKGYLPEWYSYLKWDGDGESSRGERSNLVENNTEF